MNESFVLSHQKCSLSFEGTVAVGMRSALIYPILLPASTLKGEENRAEPVSPLKREEKSRDEEKTR